jgi:transcriptional regulator with XRE-family HTH domain
MPGRGPEADYAKIKTPEGRALYHRRNELGITQVEAAELIGIDRTIYNRLEKGARIPTQEARSKISSGFGVPYEELVERRREVEGVGLYGVINELRAELATLREAKEMLIEENRILREHIGIGHLSDITVNPDHPGIGIKTS